MEDDPNYEMERAHVDKIIARYCKELAPVRKNRFEIAETVVKEREISPEELKKQKKEAKENRKRRSNLLKSNFFFFLFLKVFPIIY